MKLVQAIYSLLILAIIALVLVLTFQGFVVLTNGLDVLLSSSSIIKNEILKESAWLYVKIFTLWALIVLVSACFFWIVEKLYPSSIEKTISIEITGKRNEDNL